MCWNQKTETKGDKDFTKVLSYMTGRMMVPYYGKVMRSTGLRVGMTRRWQWRSEFEEGEMPTSY